YMIKPCNFRLLIARAIQLIKNVRKQETVTSQQSPSSGPVVVPSQPQLITSQADKVFLDRIAAITAKHISDPDFTVDRLAEMLGMGRTKLFAKTKELTGMSPNKYLQNERMSVAAGLLSEGRLTVAEVSYRVGIRDASYFNKCFKARYGVVPSRYKG
ncbi:MAG: AraC family transcriptional regulator, partial [Prevotella sp.]|nr:AraC family transcriptional regulator [Prevotella sp.]